MQSVRWTAQLWNNKTHDRCRTLPSVFNRGVGSHACSRSSCSVSRTTLLRWLYPVCGRSSIAESNPSRLYSASCSPDKKISVLLTSKMGKFKKSSSFISTRSCRLISRSVQRAWPMGVCKEVAEKCGRREISKMEVAPLFRPKASFLNAKI
jgi:hypothetical protein